MKKTITILLLICCAIYQAQSARTMQVDIRGRACSGGLGLCYIETGVEMQKTESKFSIEKHAENKIKLKINIKAITIEEQLNIFGKTVATIEKIDFLYFIQDYDFQLNDLALKSLVLNSKYNIIKKGSYPIKFVENFAEIILVLTTKT